jgi:hypothetical protein
MAVQLSAIYVPTEDLVAREIEGELIIVPLVAGIGDAEDELYTLNDTGKAIWNRLDGKTPLGEIVAALVRDYGVPSEEVERDVLGLTTELVRRRMLVEATRA